MIYSYAECGSQRAKQYTKQVDLLRTKFLLQNIHCKARSYHTKRVYRKDNTDPSLIDIPVKRTFREYRRKYLVKAIVQEIENGRDSDCAFEPAELPHKTVISNF